MIQIILSWIILIIAVLTIQSVFQKGGADNSTYTQIVIVVLITSCVMLYDGNIKGDIIYMLLAPIITGIVGLIIQFFVITSIYGGKTLFLWENPGRLIANISFYGTIGALLLIIRAAKKQLVRKASA